MQRIEGIAKGYQAGHMSKLDASIAFRRVFVPEVVLEMARTIRKADTSDWCRESTVVKRNRSGEVIGSRKKKEWQTAKILDEYIMGTTTRTRADMEFLDAYASAMERGL